MVEKSILGFIILVGLIVQTLNIYVAAGGNL